MNNISIFLEAFGYFPALLISFTIIFVLLSLFVKAMRALIAVAAIIGCLYYYIAADIQMQQKLNLQAKQLIEQISKFIP
ncbi:hypothetical protein ACHJH3_06475 [Campylobacter sp. MOP7]|uniref:hypothetical protein n=1 Tax=Campylobacter canis TaxID=3378588 RepID=UPI00387E3B75